MAEKSDPTKKVLFGKADSPLTDEQKKVLDAAFSEIEPILDKYDLGASVMLMTQTAMRFRVIFPQWLPRAKDPDDPELMGVRLDDAPQEAVQKTWGFLRVVHAGALAALGYATEMMLNVSTFLVQDGQPCPFHGDEDCPDKVEPKTSDELH